MVVVMVVVVVKFWLTEFMCHFVVFKTYLHFTVAFVTVNTRALKSRFDA